MSTIAALGAFFVTCWQNLSQIQHRYGTLADAVLSGHRTKCFFAGVDDTATTRYLSTLLGSEYVTRLSTSADVPSVFGGRAGGRRSVSRAEQRVDFAPPNTVRQMKPGEAVLLHGTLPPIHLEAVRWWTHKELAALVPLDGRGNPSPPTELPTCPLGRDKPGAETPLVDEATLDSTLAELPPLKKRRQPATRDTAQPTPRLPLDDPPPPDHPESHERTPSTANSDDSVRRRSVCVRCGTILRVGEGRIVIDTAGGGQTVTVCYPSCTAHSTTETHVANE